MTLTARYDAEREALDPRQLCERVLAQGSKSFALASKLLPVRARADAATLYTFCRRVDDAIDEAPGDPEPALRELQLQLRAAYAGGPHRDVAWQAFSDLVRETSIPENYPRELLLGMAMDVSGTRYESLDELLLYCHRVAGVVGLMMCHVLGLDRDSALTHAAQLGLAMQLTNICRDVAEDFARGRVYIPASWLRGTPAEALLDAPKVSSSAVEREPRELPERARAALSRAVDRLLVVADALYAQSRSGLRSLPWRAAVSISVAGSLYAAIGRELRARECDVYAGRAVVPAPQKAWLLAEGAAFAASEGLRRRTRTARHRPPQRAVSFPEDVLLPWEPLPKFGALS
ncbi:MAG TPA: phytoene/squalene synthase family protein [Polyangiaceae bacterium]|nr:phytoene/squalene synthase family protein [Polyangiaceae bacterium]